MDQGLGSSGSPASTIVVRVEPEVDIASIDRHRRAVAAALERRPRELCLDFTDTRIFGSDGVRLLAETALSCRYRGIELRVVESAAVTRILDFLDLPNRDEWSASARVQVARELGRLAAGVLAATT